jgi:hypothetical protein
MTRPHQVLARPRRIAAGVALLLVAGLAASAPMPTNALQRPTKKNMGSLGANFKKKGNGVIRLAYKAFDPLKDGEPKVAENLRAVAVRGKFSWWLVQLKYPIRRPARDAVLKLARRSAGYLPEATFVLEMTPDDVIQARRIAGVRWVGLLHPAYKLRPAMAGYPGILSVKGTHRFRALFHYGESRAQAIALMRGISGIDVDEAHATSSVVPFTATAAQLPSVARLSDVRYVEESPTYMLHNYNTRWASDTGERDTFWVTAPGHLTGAGQTAAISDTGINYVLDSGGNAQRAFADFTDDGRTKLATYTQTVPGNTTDALFGRTNNHTEHRKMAAYYDLAGDGYEPSENSSHGTHTSGSIAADYPDGNGAYGTYNARGQGEDGMAPGAHLIMQDVVDADGFLAGLPSDLYDLYEQVYDGNPTTGSSVTNPYASDLHAKKIYSYDPLLDARVHNYSIGPPYPLIAPPAPGFADADAADRFVADHEDFVAVSSAGNDGSDIFTIGGSQTISKNTLSSCASAGGRQPMVTLDSVAEFSSHGPTLEGRIKPDVCTPGQIVISPKGGTSWDDHYQQGTSMSSPVLVGLSTLVRQYFFDGFGPKPAGGAYTGYATGTRNLARRWNPSAALVKAVLINSADRMRGFYSGDHGSRPELYGQWPSAGQGWGRVELDNALAFDNEARRLYVADVWNTSKDALDFSAAEHMIEVAAGEPLEITVVWNDTPSSPYAGSTPLVNNLDLTVTGPDGTTYIGNNFTTQSGLISGAPAGDPGADIAETRTTPALPDYRNNVEAVRIEAPKAGTYTIRIDGGVDLSNLIGTPFGPQGYSLVASGLVGKGAKAPSAAVENAKPEISDIHARSVSSDLAMVTWETNERTTGAVLVTDKAGKTVRYDDVYNTSTIYGEVTPVNENLGEYADKKVTGLLHEVHVTGLSPGPYRYVIEATDLAATPNTTKSPERTFESTGAIFQPDANDMADLVSGDGTTALPEPGSDQMWGISKQLYTGVAPTNTTDPLGIDIVEDFLGVKLAPLLPRNRYMPAFMFRLPKSVDPSRITGAAVELTSGHDWTNHFIEDPRYTVSLLESSVEDSWGPGTSYETVEGAAVDAVASPETGLRHGGQTPYTFSFTCSDLEALKRNLAGDSGDEERLAFRVQPTALDYDQIADSLFSFETGHGRRSRGMEFRPKLILQIDGQDPVRCENTPAPKISDVRVQPAADEKPKSVVVSWETDVPSNSVVLFRKPDTSAWTQIGSPFRTTTHLVSVDNLEPYGKYEFAVRSVSCSGLETTDDNANKGYALYAEAYYPPVVDAVAAKIAPTSGQPIISWVSDQDTTGLVQWGTSPTALTNSVRHLDADGNPVRARSHEVELSGIKPCSAVYFRAVVSSGKGVVGTGPLLTYQQPSDKAKDILPMETFDTSLGKWTVTVGGGPVPTDWGWSNGTARTRIAGAIPGYATGADARLVSPPISTKGGILRLSFTETIGSEGCCDFGIVEYTTDGGKTWLPLRAVAGFAAAGEQSGDGGSSSPRDVTLTIDAVPAGKIQIGFHMTSDDILEMPGGWSIDNVVVREVLPCSPSIKQTAPKIGKRSAGAYLADLTGPVPARAARLGADVTFVVTDLNPASAAQRAAGTATCVRVLGTKFRRVFPGSIGGGGKKPVLPATGVGNGGLLAFAAVFGAAALGLWLRRRTT